MAEIIEASEALFGPDEIGAGRKNRSQAIYDIISPVIEKAALIMSISAAAEINSTIHRMSMASREIAEEWQDILLSLDDPRADVIAHHIVVLGWNGEPPPQWWATELGQLVFLHRGFPRRPVAPIEAQYILGCSRQNVYKMLKAAKRPILRRADENGMDIRRDDVYAHWVRSRFGYNEAALDDDARAMRDSKNDGDRVISTLARKPRRK